MLDLRGTSQVWRSFFPRGSFLLLAHQAGGTQQGLFFHPPHPLPPPPAPEGRYHISESFSFRKTWAPLQVPVEASVHSNFICRVQKETNTGSGCRMEFFPFLGKMLLVSASGIVLSAECQMHKCSSKSGARLVLFFFFLPINPGLRPVFILMGRGPPVLSLSVCPIIF